MPRKNHLFGYLLFLSVLFSASSCTLFQKDKPQESPDEKTTKIEAGGETEEDPFQDEAFDKYFDEDTKDSPTNEEDLPDETNETETTTDDDVDPDSYTFDDKVEEKSPSSDRSIVNEDYLVVAGSFSIKENADALVGKLKKSGFSGAEVVIFNEQEFHTASAGRFDDYSTAKAVASQLKSEMGIEAYVHRRRLPE
jgi:cell division septation protein DedD